MDKTKLPMPTSFDVAAVSNVVTYINNIERLRANSSKMRGEPSVTISPKNDWINIRGNSNQISFFLNGSKSSGRSRADIVFDFIMCKLAVEGHRDPNIFVSRTVVVFPLIELVEVGIYENDTAARRGFKRAMYLLQKLQISESAKIRKNSSDNANTYLIDDFNIKNGMCYVTLGYYIDWKNEVSQYISMPKEVFALSPKTYRTVKSIYRYVRISKPQEKFNLSLRFIALKANIAIDTIHPGRTKNEIKRIIDEVNSSKGLCLRIALIDSQYKDINDWIDKGFVVVYPIGGLIKSSKRMRNKSERKKQNEDRES